MSTIIRQRASFLSQAGALWKMVELDWVCFAGRDNYPCVRLGRLACWVSHRSCVASCLRAS